MSRAVRNENGMYEVSVTPPPTISCGMGPQELREKARELRRQANILTARAVIAEQLFKLPQSAAEEIANILSRL